MSKTKKNKLAATPVVRASSFARWMEGNKDPYKMIHKLNGLLKDDKFDIIDEMLHTVNVKHLTSDVLGHMVPILMYIQISDDRPRLPHSKDFLRRATNAVESMENGKAILADWADFEQFLGEASE